jgi:hypothetical protein
MSRKSGITIRGIRMRKNTLILLTLIGTLVLSSHIYGQKTGVRIVVNPSEPLFGTLELELEEDLVLGDEQDEDYLLFRVWDVKVNDQGHILVLDSGQSRIQEYDKDGRYLRTIGGPGQGPGEFERPIELSLDKQNNLYVTEMRKIHIFGPQGDYQNTMVTPTFLSDMVPAGDGRIIAVNHIRAEGWQNFGILILSPDGKIVKKIAEFTGLPVIRGGTTISHDYSPFIRITARGEKGFIYGYSPEYTLICTDWSGKDVLILRKDEPYHRLSHKEKNKIIDDHIEATARYGSSWPRDLVEKAANLPDHRPFFDRILVDDQGRIYIRKLKSVLDESEGWEFDIFRKDGTYIYNTQLPITPQVIRAGAMYHISSDEETGEVKVIRTRIKNWDDLRNPG